MTDLKPVNWGKIGRRIVCVDYGNQSLDFTSKSMKIARWWEKKSS